MNEQTKLQPQGPMPKPEGYKSHARTNINLAVKAARAHQGWVKDVRAVGACQHHHIGGRVEAWT